MVTSQLRFVASKDLDGSMIICETYFGERPSGLSTTAENVPTYTDTQTSSTLKVMGKCSIVEVFTARRHASAVYAAVVSLSLCQ